MLPKNRPPITPGEIIKEEFLDALEMTQGALAEKIGMSIQTVNLLINGKRAVTADTAIRLGEVFGNSPEMWMKIQADVDLWQAFQARGKGLPAKRTASRTAARKLAR